MPRDVYRRDLQQTLLDIEDWTAEVRDLLESLPADSKIATIDDGAEMITPMPVDDTPVSPDVPAIVVRPLLNGNVAIGGLVLPCGLAATGSCDPLPNSLCAEVQARHLHQGMRRIEILAGVCRYVLGRMDPSKVIRRDLTGPA